MRLYRKKAKQPKLSPESVVVPDDPEEKNDVGDYLTRSRTEFRRTEVQYLIDLNKSDDEIVAAFDSTASLRKYITGSKAPLVMLRRDIALLREDDDGKPEFLIGLERTRRLALRHLSDPGLSATVRSRIIQTLAKIEQDLAVVRGEARTVPGRGLVVNYDDDDDDWEDDEAEYEDDDLPEPDHETDEEDWWVHVDGSRRKVHWFPGKGVPRNRPRRRGELMMGSVRSYNLPKRYLPIGQGDGPDRGFVSLENETVGYYRLVKGEIPDEFKPIPPVEEQREMLARGIPNPWSWRSSRNR
jgi:hypothetical protein